MKLSTYALLISATQALRIQYKPEPMGADPEPIPQADPVPSPQDDS
jgi:hypothetical protein